MTAIAASARNLALALPRLRSRGLLRRAAILVATLVTLVAVVAARPDLLEVITGSLADAYLQVSVFVAATLLLMAWSERAFGIDVTRCLAEGSPWRLATAAALGALPGCGGAVVVVTQYVAGRTTFGALVAVLTATMGDAAFLLLAREPETGLAMILLGYGTGLLAGHATERLLPAWKAGAATTATSLRPARTTGRLLRRAWLVLLVPGIVFAALEAFQVDLALVPWLAGAALATGIVGSLIGILLWLVQAPAAGEAEASDPLADTAMVTVWVVAAFLAFGLVTTVLGLDVAALLDAAWMLLPLLGAAIGLLPGCGPQIDVATFYLAGLLPVSALAANAISNDGDALFPAIALAPRAAAMATLLTTLPALAVGYGLHMALPVP